MYKKDRQIPVEKIKFQNVSIAKYAMLSAIWYNLYNLKKVRSTHGRVLLLVKLQASACDFNKKHSSIVCVCVCFFFYVFQIVPMVPNRSVSHT